MPNLTLWAAFESLYFASTRKSYPVLPPAKRLKPPVFIWVCPLLGDPQGGGFPFGLPVNQPKRGSLKNDTHFGIHLSMPCFPGRGWMLLTQHSSTRRGTFREMQKAKGVPRRPASMRACVHSCVSVCVCARRSRSYFQTRKGFEPQCFSK